MNTTRSITNRSTLTNEAYRTSARLQQRISLYDHQVEPLDLPSWVVDQIVIEPNVGPRSGAVPLWSNKSPT